MCVVSSASLRVVGVLPAKRRQQQKGYFLGFFLSFAFQIAGADCAETMTPVCDAVTHKAQQPLFHAFLLGCLHTQRYASQRYGAKKKKKKSPISSAITKTGPVYVLLGPPIFFFKAMETTSRLG